MEMTPLAARALGALLERHTGQQLVPGRRWRLDIALQPILRAHDIASLDMLAAQIAMGRSEALTREVVEALLNHETSFYRDLASFRSIDRQVLPMLAEARRGRRLRVWSAGCATGQEPYSLAMAIGADPRWATNPIEIFATDVSHAAIRQAREGLYSQFEAQRGMPVTELLRHFESENEAWRISPTLRVRVDWAVHNLLEPPLATGFDLILCRNVLLYFTPETRGQVFDRLASAIAPDGVLMLGAGETVLGQTDAFEPHPDLKGFYRLRA